MKKCYIMGGVEDGRVKDLLRTIPLFHTAFKDYATPSSTTSAQSLPHLPRLPSQRSVLVSDQEDAFFSDLAKVNPPYLTSLSL
ncbi:UNVERIFIED_CONTAM: hypothetical protein HDU68_008023 [Siphonaria sp. JEL0065]|nr:hypothetical protein HDU68_008023 [Siphonaria sp. JEL0065]